MTKKYFVKDDDFFAIGTEAVEEQPADLNQYNKIKEENSLTSQEDLLWIDA